MKFKQCILTLLIGIILTSVFGCGLLSKDSNESSQEIISGTVYVPQINSSNGNNMNMSLLLSVDGAAPLSNARVCLLDITTQKESNFCSTTNEQGEYEIPVESITFWDGRGAIKATKGSTQVFSLYDCWKVLFQVVPTKQFYDIKLQLFFYYKICL